MAKVNRYNTTAEKEAADKERTKLEISSKNKNTPRATEMPKFKHKGMSEERFDEIASKIRKGERVSFAEMSELAKVGIDPDEFIETLSSAVTTKYDDDPSISTDNSVLDDYNPDVRYTKRIEDYFRDSPKAEVFRQSMASYRNEAIKDGDIKGAFKRWAKDNGLVDFLREEVPEEDHKAAISWLKNWFENEGSDTVRQLNKDKAEWNRGEKRGEKAQNTANKISDLKELPEDDLIALALDKHHPDHEAAAVIVGEDPTLMGKALTRVPPEDFVYWKNYFKLRPSNTVRTSQEVAGSTAGYAGGKRLLDIGEAISEVNAGKRYSKEEWQQILKDNPNEEFSIVINRDPIHKENDDLWNKQMSVYWNKGHNSAKIKGLKAMGDFLVGAHGHIIHNKGASSGSGEVTETENEFNNSVDKMISSGDPRIVYKKIYGDGSQDKEDKIKERKSTVTEDERVAQGETEKDVSLKYYDKMFKQTGAELQAVREMLTTLDPESEAYTRYKAKEATLSEFLDKYRDARKKELVPAWRKRHNLSDPAFDEFLENSENRKKVASAFNKLDAWAKEHTETTDMHTDFDITLSNAIRATAEELGVPEEKIKEEIQPAIKGLNERTINKNGVAGKFTPGAIRQTIRNIKDFADTDKATGEGKTIWTALDENLALRWDKDLQDRKNRRSALSSYDYKDVLGDEMFEDLFGDDTAQLKAAGLTDDEISALNEVNSIKPEKGINDNKIIFDPIKKTFVFSLNKNADGSDKDTYTRAIFGKGGKVQKVKVGSNNNKYLNDTYVDNSGQVRQDTLRNRLNYEDEASKQEQDKLSGTAGDFAERQKDADRRNAATKKANKAEEQELVTNAQNYLQKVKEDEASGKTAKNAQEARKEHADYEAKANTDRQRNAKAFTGVPDTSLEGLYASEQTRKLAEKDKTAETRAKESASNLEAAKSMGVGKEALANLEKNKRIDEANAKAAKERKEAEAAQKKAEQEYKRMQEEAKQNIIKTLHELGGF